MVNYIGTDFRDVLTGTQTTWYGLGGDDDLRATGNYLTIMYGDEGNDLLVFQGSATYGELYGGRGNDSLFASTGIIAADYLSGGTGNDYLAGYAGNDVLEGGFGNDALFGGDGNDQLEGGDGIDALVGDAGNDTLYGGDGDDGRFAIEVGHNFFDSIGGLYGGAGLDYLDGGRGNDYLDGGADADTLIGGEGNDTLLGGTGIDRLDGGFGNDLFYVDTNSDIVVEAEGGGSDRVVASASYTLRAGVFVETLTTANVAGTGSINLVGNEFSQTIQGNAGINNLVGGGGNDVLSGLGGNDNYFVDSQSDIIDEVAGGGTADRVYTVGTFVLAADDNIEFLATTNAASTAAINLVGNALSQTITGNAGVNAIYGGLGNDTLLGLGGSDIFIFNTALGPSNVDTLSDFTAADTIYLENAVFTGLTGTGTLTADQFVSNTTGLATTASQHIIYESDTGNLYYDSNGNAAGGSVLFAHLSAGLAITSADLFII
jgi:Ca2+-binding RTX toxin-like protein